MHLQLHYFALHPLDCSQHQRRPISLLHACNHASSFRAALLVASLLLRRWKMSAAGLASLRTCTQFSFTTVSFLNNRRPPPSVAGPALAPYPDSAGPRLHQMDFGQPASRRVGFAGSFCALPLLWSLPHDACRPGQPRPSAVEGPPRRSAVERGQPPPRLGPKRAPPSARAPRRRLEAPAPSPPPLLVQSRPPLLVRKARQSPRRPPQSRPRRRCQVRQ